MKKEEYAKSVCLFLAELLRTRKISLQRAAEIAQKVVDHVNLLDTEADFLKLIKELTYDFEELFKLEQRVMMHMETSKRLELENRVREFVIGVMGYDPNLALSVLQAAISEQTDMTNMCAKFPQFKEFIEHNAQPNAQPRVGTTIQS